MWEQLKRIIKPNGAIVLTASQPFTTTLISSNMKMFKYCWVWEKSAVTNFLNAKKQPLRKHEDIVVFSKGSEKYNPQGLKKKESFTKQGRKETDNYGSQDRSAGGYFQEFTGYPVDIIRENSSPTGKSLHPTQKPVELLSYLIATYTNPDDTILDFTMGSGSTGIAAINQNCNFIGIEMDDKYFEIAKNRIDQHQAQGSLF